MSALVPARARLAAAFGSLTLALLFAGVDSAQAASVIGPGGQVSSCYVKKGKAKGTMRVVPPGKRCRRNEKPLTLSAQGQPGLTGQTGGQGGSGQTSSSLESRVTQLESVLSGITNGDLLNTIGSVDSLCAEVPTVVGQVNSVRTVLSGLSLTAPLLALGSLVVPALPAALPAFACP